MTCASRCLNGTWLTPASSHWMKLSSPILESFSESRTLGQVNVKRQLMDGRSRSSCSGFSSSSQKTSTYWAREPKLAFGVGDEMSTLDFFFVIIMMVRGQKTVRIQALSSAALRHRGGYFR